MNNGLEFQSYKVYPNPYVVLNSEGILTKHYYAGDQRVASNVGDAGSMFYNKQAAPASATRAANKEQADPGADIKNYLEKAGYKDMEVQKEFAKAANYEMGVYYLHGDHLGKATMVTNWDGVTTQFFLNLPFGETMAEQQEQTAYHNPYNFNAKELDSETGLYYYGARYYNPRLSIWYGVDPLAVYNPVMETEFYGDGQHNGGVYFWGNLNPYIYTYQNPIKYIDPNGKQADFHTLLNDLENSIHESEFGHKIEKWGNSFTDEQEKEAMSWTPFAGFIIAGDLADRYNKDGELPTQDIAEVVILSRINKVTSKFGVHANSKTSKRAQHGYVIFDKLEKKFVKVGVSAGKIGKRMERQIRKWNEEAGFERYTGKVVKHIEKGTKNARGKIYEWEGKVARALEKAEHLIDRDKHVKPRN